MVKLHRHVFDDMRAAFASSENCVSILKACLVKYNEPRKSRGESESIPNVKCLREDPMALRNFAIWGS